MPAFSSFAAGVGACPAFFASLGRAAQTLKPDNFREGMASANFARGSLSNKCTCSGMTTYP